MPRTPTRLLFLAVLLVLLAAGVAVRPVSADFPIVKETPGAARTVAWAMNTSQGLSLANVVLEDGRAELPWAPLNVSWSTGSQFAANGSLGADLVGLPSGVVLKSDDRNHVADPDFSSPASWDFVNGSAGRLNATWNPIDGVGLFRYASPTTQMLWDHMDPPGNWSYVSDPGGAVGGLALNKSEKKEGSGSIGMNISFVNAGHGGIQRQGVNPVDWSGVDQLVLWVYLNSSAPLLFNLSATDASSVRHYTSPQALVPGWHELTVDLTQLGSAPSRLALYQVSLWVWASGGVPQRSILFDAVRVGAAKQFTDTAIVSQVISKDNATTAFLGSATLGFEWSPVNVSGVTYEAVADLLGPGGRYVGSWGPGTPEVWQSFAVDVSASTAAPGDYLLNLTVTVRVNTTAACNMTVIVDNASLFFPNRRNGTYLSNAISLGSQSEFLDLSWDGSAPLQTDVNLSLRSGNNSSPGTDDWSPWRTWSDPAMYSDPSPAGRYFQLRADLNTTNASRSPVLSSAVLYTRHRASQGTVVSDLFTAASDFLGWRTILADWNGTPNTSISFFVGDGTYGFRPVALGGNLSFFPDRTIRWQAILMTADGLRTPTLGQVRLVYEYLGPIVRLGVVPSGPLTLKVGDWRTFEAIAYDAGGHVNGSGIVTWSTTDPGNRVYNNDTRHGAYQATRWGDYNVTAVLQGMNAYVTVRVHVENVTGGGLDLPLGSWLFSPSFLLPLGIAAVAGFGAYEFAVRRMFAIDDVFVISRDGRLMLHNTRRMRADRDEDVLSGMLTAMISFLRDWDPEENGKARRFDYGNKTALLEHGEHVFVAAVYSGRVPGWAARDLNRFVRDLETVFSSTFAHWTGAPQDLHGLREFTEKFVSRIRYRGNGRGTAKPV